MAYSILQCRRLKKKEMSRIHILTEILIFAVLIQPTGIFNLHLTENLSNLNEILTRNFYI